MTNLYTCFWRGNALALDYQTQQRAIADALREGNTTRDHELINVLMNCRRGERCNLPTCRFCIRRLRRTLVKEMSACFEPILQRTNLSGVQFSGVLRGETYPLGQLDRIDLRSLNERIQQHHEHSNLPLVFCGIKNVLDTEPASKTWLSWLPTVEGLVIGSSEKEVRDALENVYSFDFRDGLLKWPLSSLPCAVGHAIDSGFPWRRGGRVEAGHLREFALCLSRYDMSVLYTLNGCRRETKRIVLNPSVRERLEKITSAQTNGK
jgi:hypothetical protein